MPLCDAWTKKNSHISHFCITTVLHCVFSALGHSALWLSALWFFCTVSTSRSIRCASHKLFSRRGRIRRTANVRPARVQTQATRRTTWARRWQREGTHEHYARTNFKYPDLCSPSSKSCSEHCQISTQTSAFSFGIVLTPEMKAVGDSAHANKSKIAPQSGLIHYEKDTRERMSFWSLTPPPDKYEDKAETAVNKEKQSTSVPWHP